MHKLFWKIFISFWIALVIFASTTLIVASQYLDRLKEWLTEIDGKEPIPLLLVDRDAHDLLGRAVPERIVARMAREASQHEATTASHHVTIAFDQSEYRLIPDYQNVTLGRVLRRPRVFLLPLIVAAV